MTRRRVIYLFFILASCATSRNQLKFDSVKNGQNLDNISPVTVNTFFNVWVYNKKVQKLDLNVHRLYTDSIYTYFGKYHISLFNSKPTFFKVESDSLEILFPNYSNFYGVELTDYLWDNVVPKEDIKIWQDLTTTKPNQLTSVCSRKENRPINNFKLIGKKVILTITWKINCSELSMLKGKKYQAIYNLTTMQIEK